MPLVSASTGESVSTGMPKIISTTNNSAIEIMLEAQTWAIWRSTNVTGPLRRRSDQKIIAQRWFRAAAERGHGQAQLMLGRYLDAGAAGELDPAEARTWLERAAAQGIAEAEQDLATLSP